MTVFNSQGLARTFDYKAGDAGVVPLVAGHYIQNTGDETLIFAEIFRYPNYSDISLNQWLASNPVQVVADHLLATDEFVESLPTDSKPAPVVWYDLSKAKGGDSK